MRIRAFLATLASICLAVFLLWSPSQGQHAFAAQPIGNWWPPHPRDQVQFFHANVALTPGAELQLTIVPNDRWLVLVPTSGPGFTSTSEAHLIQDLNGQFTTKAHGTGIWSQAPATVPSMGWTFAPGSRVIIKNIQPSLTNTVDASMFGYYAPL